MFITSYVGCYPRNPGARQFIANPGDYDPATITSEVCKLKCGKLGYTYAGLTQGMLCLCGNTLTTTAVTDTYCSQACFGNPAEFCGASLYYSVHTTPQLLTGFTISVPGMNPCMQEREGKREKERGKGERL
ncbi:hypothetical protein KUTeg_004358 [Tegillarca granosa]|uniref:WSC domain-containing protein n=1 Tax=Tegillarca granosa TaxID=220873 RepID=A0ABQ9FPP9_TEGGR|nr:hypothetical protein KUTeg_004358 [Tegillarca granosa]